MKLLKLAWAIAIVLLIGCSKNDSQNSDCIESMLEESNMIEYNGQEIGCKFFLELYHHKNRQFFLLGNHCADMISYPIDCEGKKICENDEDSECKDFYKHAERIGIIGISE
jgi:hypothetical protein